MPVRSLPMGDVLFMTHHTPFLPATLHATFYASSSEHPPGEHADLIIPVTTLADNSGDVASVPPAFSVRFHPVSLLKVWSLMKNAA